VQDILYKVDGEPVERLPSTTGVYRFFSKDNALLYVGKTIDFRARIRAHFQTARKEARHAKMMQGVARIECETTSSELTALLFESRAVKVEQPLFNRRLRKKRQLWSARLAPDTDGYLGVYPQKLTSIDQLQSGYGLFSNQTQLKNWLRNAAAEHRLCVQRIGLDRGKGRCFGRQINRCDGACTGEQSAQQFNDVLADILYRYQLAVWPYTDPIWIRERDANRAQLGEGGEIGPGGQGGHSGQGGMSGDWHVFHYWTYLGSHSEPQAIDTDISDVIADGLDRDAYRILLSFLRNEKLNLYQFDSKSGALKPIDNRFA
jgi:predicted GIY-YIG superfamily endonuclease